MRVDGPDAEPGTGPGTGATADAGAAAGEVDFAAVFGAAPAPTLVLDRGLVIRAANAAYERAVGVSGERLVGRHMFDAFPARPGRPEAATVDHVRTSLERVLATGSPDTLPAERYDVPDAAGRLVERWWSPVHVPVRDAGGAVRWVLHRVEDVTAAVRSAGGDPSTAGPAGGLSTELLARAQELQQLNEELREARDQLAARALHDPATGLLVRSVFLEELGLALARLPRHPGPVAVLFIDVDRLKPVNDTYGHAAGDELIRACAQRLRSSVRPSDPVARLGGDEFVVLLADLHDVAEAEAVARRVLEDVSAPLRLSVGAVVRPSASIGVAATESAATSPDTLVSRADTAMYRAKQVGRGRVELFDEAVHLAAQARQQLQVELGSAVRRDQLRLHFQPIVDLASGETHAVEALLRWDHPRKGLLAAAEFVGLAEDSRLIVDIGSWVVARACAQLAAWDAALGPRAPGRVFLNLSATELSRPGLDDLVATQLATHSLDPQRLVLELTESGVLADDPRTGEGALDEGAGSAIDALLGLGCELAIDDFGTGYSSLSRLVRLRAGIVKIDRSFVRSVATEQESAAVVSAVLLLAHNLRKSVVAEGVEDARTLAVLEDLGCTYAQGFHLALPQPAEQLTAALGAATPA